MTKSMRLTQGGRINRDRPVNFSFDGKTYRGFEGDSLASALLANNVHLVGRSFKYHRPRGIVAAGSDEPNALVRVGNCEERATPNLRATQVEIFEGLIAQSQNRFPSLAFDLGALNDAASGFFPAGFYYKTFMWPRWGWHRLYEPVVRRMAGLGRAPGASDTDSYAQLYAHCDVLVVGAGASGLAAALAAAQAGARVILCDEQAEFGGGLLDECSGTEHGIKALGWLAETLDSLGALPRVTLLSRATAFGVFAQNFVGIAERVTDHLSNPDPRMPRERLWQIRAKEIVLASGAIERPMLFPANDRPGIMLASAARSYLHRYGVKVGERVVIAAASDSAYEVAYDLSRAGIMIAAIADARPHISAEIQQKALAIGAPVYGASQIAGTGGRLRVCAARITTIGGKNPKKVACDAILMAGGFTPSVHLFSQARGKLVFDAGIGAFIPDNANSPVISAGACRGVFGLEMAIIDGREAGTLASARAKARGTPPTRSIVSPSLAPCIMPSPLPGKVFVDFQNDVTSRDVELAVQEGFVSVEHVKRYTTVGMATDQGKTSNINALGLVAGASGRDIPGVGLTTFRMPYTPTTFGTFAGAACGELFDPVRCTPIHECARTHGAVFEDVGLWKRARYFPRNGESMAQAVARECRAVRQSAGLFDATTLGKIEVVGPDAAILLERLYVNGFSNLGVGRARYGLLLREDGFIMDDGVIGRIAADRFHVTTTTGGAPRVLAMMEDYLQTEWSDLQVWLTSTTEEWAVIAVQGPKAREIIAPLVEEIDLDATNLPHMALAHGHICGAKLRLFRVSFTGELGFELNVPADHGARVWQAIYEAGVSHGLTAYGTETMHVLRAEKGYIIVGQETDGTVIPADVGLNWAINKKKPDFAGKRSLARAAMKAASRKQMVGLLTDDPAIVLEEGAQIVSNAHVPMPCPILGHVTSSYFSATLGRSIALAMVSGGASRMGERLYVPMPNSVHPVCVVAPVFYDPEGERLHA